MIKLPKMVKDIIKKLRDKGYDAYAVGPCVRDSLAGRKPIDWDIATNARLDVLKEVFEDARVLSEKYSVIRLHDYDSEDDIIVDVSTFRKKEPGDGGFTFSNDIRGDLNRKDFTVNSMADSGFEFIDDFGGRNDVQAKLIRTIGNADELFKAEPVRMLKALRITADLGFDLSQEVYEAIKANHGLINQLSPDKVRKDFLAIIGGEHAGKALNMIVDMGLLPDILGEEAGNNLSHREKTDMVTICENIDKTKPVPERRMGVLISILSEKKAMSVIDRLDFQGDLRQNLIDVAKDLPSFHFAQQPQTYKKFIYEHAPMERSDYLLNLQKALLIVFDYSIDTKIKSKMYLLKEFEKNGDPIFVEDLAIDANDLMEAGILDDPEACDKMLHMLIERLHVEPKKNTRAELFKLAKTYKKNKLKAYLRGVTWMR
ncbi:MAG: CCA tRNA nucleotidyltransferase [Firmicutes bacterium]|nr:CCA tRNA nucleotidyltransferase [Bacillota bacterium]